MKVNRQEVGFVHGCLYYLYMLLVQLFAHAVCFGGLILSGLFLAFLPEIFAKSLVFLFLKPLAECLKFLYSLIV